MEQSDSLRLRKANRVKTVHSSLAIEGNTLSEGDVTAILEGKTVIAPQRQILEVKNALMSLNSYTLSVTATDGQDGYGNHSFSGR